MVLFFYIYTTCIIPEYSYTFVYYQHWCDLGAVWLGAGRDTQTFLAAYTTCSLSSDSPAKLLKISSPVMRGIEIFKNWQICELNTCSLSSDSQFQFLSWEELKFGRWIWGERAGSELTYLSIFLTLSVLLLFSQKLRTNYQIWSQWRDTSANFAISTCSRQNRHMSLFHED